LHLPLRTLFEHPTVEALAVAVYQRNGTEYKKYMPMLAFRRNGNKTPIFCIHAGGGIGTVYSNLAKEFGSDQPIYALQARGLEDDEIPHDNFEDMSMTYINEIKKIQPTGPYQILGWSIGGNLAHQIAYHLEQMGDKVGFVGLLDSSPNIGKDKVSNNNLDQSTLLQKSLEEIVEKKDIPSSYEDKILLLKTKLEENEMLPKDAPQDFIDRMINQNILNYKRLIGYRPRIIKAQILTFRASKDIKIGDDNNHSWEAYSKKKVRKFLVQATHATMTEAMPSHEIARVLSQLILNAESESSNILNHQAPIP
jgi:thioesterase domain-containing protein